MKINSFLFFIFLVISSCKKTFTNETKIQHFIAEETNGYTQSKNVNGISYTLQYKPTDVLVKQELITNPKIQGDSLRKKYRGYIYFTLSLSKNGRELSGSLAHDRRLFSEISNKLNFEMNDYVHLISPKKDTLDVFDFSSPRMYGMGSSTDIILVFQRDEKLLKSKHLIFLIREFGLQTGDVTFKINTNIINNEPSVEF